jgi:hypothetical protein
MNIESVRICDVFVGSICTVKFIDYLPQRQTRVLFLYGTPCTARTRYAATLSAVCCILSARNFQQADAMCCWSVNLGLGFASNSRCYHEVIEYYSPSSPVACDIGWDRLSSRSTSPCSENNQQINRAFRTCACYLLRHSSLLPWNRKTDPEYCCLKFITVQFLEVIRRYRGSCFLHLQCRQKKARNTQHSTEKCTRLHFWLVVVNYWLKCTEWIARRKARLMQVNYFVWSLSVPTLSARLL